MTTLVFAKFPKLSAGNDCPGAAVLLDGKVIGCVQREVEWQDVGTVSVRYAGKVVGYTAALFREFADRPGFEGPDDVVFKTLAEVRTAIRKALASTGVEKKAEANRSRWAWTYDAIRDIETDIETEGRFEEATKVKLRALTQEMRIVLDSG